MERRKESKTEFLPGIKHILVWKWGMQPGLLFLITAHLDFSVLTLFFFSVAGTRCPAPLVNHLKSTISRFPFVEIQRRTKETSAVVSVRLMQLAGSTDLANYHAAPNGCGIAPFSKQPRKEKEKQGLLHMLRNPERDHWAHGNALQWLNMHIVSCMFQIALMWRSDAACRFPCWVVY